MYTAERLVGVLKSFREDKNRGYTGVLELNNGKRIRVYFKDDHTSEDMRNCLIRVRGLFNDEGSFSVMEKPLIIENSNGTPVKNKWFLLLPSFGSIIIGGFFFWKHLQTNSLILAYGSIIFFIMFVIIFVWTFQD